MKTIICQIKEMIEERLDKGYRKFIIFPFGDIGMQVKSILNDVYGIQEEYILDNYLWKYNPHIKKLSFLNGIDCGEFSLLLSSVNFNIYEDLKQDAQKYFLSKNIVELPCMLQCKKEKKDPEYITKIGKYSSGPICRNHMLIESIGAFCSFAAGVEVVRNHPMNYITTHAMIYEGASDPKFRSYEEFNGRNWCFEGVQPKREKLKIDRRITIGNDVWLGHNVLITNYANVGNGVIAGAGTIITKDVPDYAVVVGAPARIIRYRYAPEEIKSLNKIAWWSWTDDDIRARYDDFYLPADEFIRKYL